MEHVNIVEVKPERQSKIRKKRREIFAADQDQQSVNHSQTQFIYNEQQTVIPRSRFDDAGSDQPTATHCATTTTPKAPISFDNCKMVRNEMFYGQTAFRQSYDYGKITPVVSDTIQTSDQSIKETVRQRKLISRKDKISNRKFEELVIGEWKDSTTLDSKEITTARNDLQKYGDTKDKPRNCQTRSDQTNSTPETSRPTVDKARVNSKESIMQCQSKPDLDKRQKQNTIDVIQTLLGLNENSLSLRGVLNNPVPAHTVMKTFIQRSPSAHKLTLELYLDDLRFLLRAQAQNASIGCNSYISLSKEVDKKLEAYMGKLRSDFVGSMYNLYDNGSNKKGNKQSLEQRSTLSNIEYEYNLLGINGPRKLSVAVVNPAYSDKSVFRLKDKETLFDVADKYPGSVLIFKNKQPVWSQKLKTFALNFGGRVKMPSIKNFILEDLKGNHVMVFGRIDADKFNLEFRYPLSPFQAFGIAMTAFDFKFNCQ